MPIYEYSCGACHHHFEALQKISEGLKRQCPACGKMKLKKMISQVAFRLKGSGWYETDFKNNHKKPEHQNADSGASGGDAGEGGKSSDSGAGEGGKSSDSGADGGRDGGKSNDSGAGDGRRDSKSSGSGGDGGRDSKSSDSGADVSKTASSSNA